MWTVHADDGTLVGFVMISDGIEHMEADLIGPYYLWRLLIDRRFQRRGYGTAALDAIVAYVRTRPGAAILWTSAGQGEGSPQPFYERYGFVADGPHRRGRGRPPTGPAAGGVMKALDPIDPGRRPDRRAPADRPDRLADDGQPRRAAPELGRSGSSGRTG